MHSAAPLVGSLALVLASAALHAQNAMGGRTPVPPSRLLGAVLAESKIGNASPDFPDTLDDDDEFGTAIALLGDVDGDGRLELAIGSPGDEDGRGATGAVWLLSLEIGGAVEVRAKLTGSTAGLAGVLPGARFGSGLAALGDLDGDGGPELAVGAPGSGTRGAIWILFLEPSFSVKASRRLDLGGQLAAAGGFGSALAGLGDLDGDGVVDLAVGEPVGYEGAMGSQSGAVWILFLRSDGGLRSVQKITQGKGGFQGTLNYHDFFGSSLALLPDASGAPRLAVGAWARDDGGQDVGAVWILSLTPLGTVASQIEIYPGGGGFGGMLAQGDGFGSAVASVGDLNGDGLLDLSVGARLDDEGPTPGIWRGSVWNLFLEPDGSVRSWQKVGALSGGLVGPLEAGDEFGSAAAALGDYDGDGSLDLAVGAPEDDDGGARRGATWLLSLRPDGTVLGERLLSDAPGGFEGTLDRRDRFGAAVAEVGDLDGDGNVELAVASPDDSGLGPARGAVWIFFPDADGRVLRYQRIDDAAGGFTGSLDDRDNFGTSLAALGDLDGDGVPDLAVGATGDDEGGTDRGAVWILFLAPDGTVRAHEKIASGTGGLQGTLDDRDYFGQSLAALGGSAPLRLAVGARGDDDGGSGRGAVWLLSLRADGTVLLEGKLGALAGGLGEGLSDGDGFGSSLAALGDLDGDGVPDLAAGATGDDDGGPNQGAVWVVFLRPDGGLKRQQKISATAGGLPVRIAGLGSSVARVDDLDGNGVPDLAVGSPTDAGGGTNQGAFWLLSLGRDGRVYGASKIGARAGRLRGPLDDQDYFGSSLASLADRDGDGRGELAVGAPYDDDGGMDHGALWVLSVGP